jgi:hypothetical protein
MLIGRSMLVGLQSRAAAVRSRNDVRGPRMMDERCGARRAVLFPCCGLPGFADSHVVVAADELVVVDARQMMFLVQGGPNGALAQSPCTRAGELGKAAGVRVHDPQLVEPAQAGSAPEAEIRSAAVVDSSTAGGASAGAAARVECRSDADRVVASRSGRLAGGRGQQRRSGASKGVLQHPLTWRCVPV